MKNVINLKSREGEKILTALMYEQECKIVKATLFSYNRSYVEFANITVTQTSQSSMVSRPGD